MESRYVTEILEVVLNHIAMIKVDELHSEAKAIALKTGCRAIDAYYIATAKLVNAILVTNDSVMKNNADRAGGLHEAICAESDSRSYIPCNIMLERC